MISDLYLMEEQDLRTVSEPAREELRKRGIGMLKKGKRKKEVAEMLGVNKNTVTNWSKKYKAQGSNGLKGRKCGPKARTGSLLTMEQERQIQRLIRDTMPDQLKLAYGLWTRKAVAELVEREFKVHLANSTMGDYLRSWGFTPQKPKKKAYEQCPAKVKQWLDHEYPKIEQKAKVENAEIHWGDETGVRNDCQHGRSYAPKGRTPIKKSMAKRFSVNMISTVTNRGKVEFMIYSDRMNSERFIIFLNQLIKGRGRKILLILDNLRVHHSAMVKEWAEKHKDRIELFHLPSYSPEKNPDEYLNCDLKNGLSHRPAPKNAERLHQNLLNHMNMLQSNPERVSKYFKHPDIAYAA